MKFGALYLFAGCALAAAAFAAAMFSYWLLIDTDMPIESRSVDLLNEFGRPQNSFRRGELMVIDRENCASRSVSVQISRALIRGDGFQYVLPSSPFLMEAGCKHTINGIVIPSHVIPGKYEYWVTVQYSNNPLTTGSILLKTPELTVLP